MHLCPATYTVVINLFQPMTAEKFVYSIAWHQWCYNQPETLMMYGKSKLWFACHWFFTTMIY